MTNFLLTGLDPTEFRDFFSLSDAQLRARGMRRVVADDPYSFPCRVSLQDAKPGEELLLLPYVHQPTDSPYRASGPIFVRRDAGERARVAGEIPPYLARRMLSVRAYNAQDEIVDAEVCPGGEAGQTLERLLDNERAAYLHVHFARYGCFGCRVDRHAA